MTAVQAARTSLPEYIALTEAYAKRVQLSWEQIRWIEWHQTILSPNIKQTNKPKRPKDLMLFPWEENDAPVKPAECHITAEQRNELNKIFNLI